MLMGRGCLIVNKYSVMKRKMVTVLVALGTALLIGGSCTSIRPVTATSNPVGSKVGMSRTVNIFGFWTGGGDYSIRTAAKNGGITKISTVDLSESRYAIAGCIILETIVTGE